MKLLRKILLPFSILYALILKLRNFAYDKSWLTSTEFDFPIICVGNLSLGGTGKSPAIEYLIQLLKKRYQVATLSRGYGRGTKGFLKVKESNQAIEVGDEPLQFKKKFPDVEVAVDEQRVRGLHYLLNEKDIDLVLLDDAYQHRKVKAGLYILLSVYQDLYVDDLVLPAGNLREPASGAERADIILITKCPENLSLEKQNQVVSKIKPLPHQALFFSSIKYDEFVYSTNSKKRLTDLYNYTLVTGIANPKPLVNFLNKINPPHLHLAFPDHHNFSAKEIAELKKAECILTTEKDFTRLQSHLPLERLFYIPIQMKIINHSDKFDALILHYVKSVSSQITNS